MNKVIIYSGLLVVFAAAVYILITCCYVDMPWYMKFFHSFAGWGFILMDGILVKRIISKSKEGHKKKEAKSNGKR